MNAKTTKTSSRAAHNGTANGTVKTPVKKQGKPQNAQAEHAAKGGKALMKAWKRIAERNGEGY